MSVSALVSALVVGLAVGVAGRLVVPGPKAAPVWLTCALGVAAALLGSIVVLLVDADLAVPTGLRLVIQAGFAGVAVVLAVVTADRQRPPGPNALLIHASREQAGGKRREREERS
ncbi:MAG: hypothetical protein WA890_31400 [Micromonospora sp.]